MVVLFFLKNVSIGALCTIDKLFALNLNASLFFLFVDVASVEIVGVTPSPMALMTVEEEIDEVLVEMVVAGGRVVVDGYVFESGGSFSLTTRTQSSTL